MEDDELISRVAAGDDTALRELFFRHAPWLSARLRSTLPVADVEDVLQETFLAVWRGARNYEPRGVGAGWIWGIARRQASLWLRNHGRPADMLSRLASAEPAEVEDPSDAAVWRVDLAAAVEALGPPGGPDRELWRLLYVEDRPASAVAALMGVPEGTIKSRAHRLRRLLQVALGRRARTANGGS